MTAPNPQREQLQSLKKNLADSLGESWPAYFQTLKQYLQQSITKQQLDAQLNYLSPSQQKLHNRFILSILSNCMNTKLEQPEVVVVQKGRHHDCKHYQARYNTRIMTGLSVEEKQRLIELEKTGLDPDDSIEEELELKGSVEGIPKTCLEERDLPTGDQLHARIKFVSALNGLNASCSPQVVMLLNDALHVY